MNGPISPQDIAKAKVTVIPEHVFQVVNDLLARNFSKGSSRVVQEDIVSALLDNFTCTREQIFKECWLNFEEAYAAAGWKVTYEKPDPGDTFDAYFMFEAKK